MCIFCGSALPDGRIGFRDLCPDCSRDLHICRHCGFYKPGVYRDCTETVPEAVRDKDRMNFCEYFKPRADLPGAGREGQQAKAARSDFDKLFG